MNKLRGNETLSDLLQNYTKGVNQSRAELVLIFGAAIVNRHRKSLKDEVWNVLEQILLASLELSHSGWEQFCLRELKTRFPKSIRVARLEAMTCEAHGDFAKAADLYSNILAEKPEDLQTRRRIISLARSQNKIADCIETLNRHLEEFCTDLEAWQELGDIYVNEMLLSRALFCFEELLLHDPRRIFTILTVAELAFSTGDLVNSRRYFCLALNINPSCARALWGVILTNNHQQFSSSTAKTSTSTSDRSEAAAVVTSKLTEQVGKRLRALYNDQDESKIVCQSETAPSFKSVALSVLKRLTE